jgi:hypothetical protein
LKKGGFRVKSERKNNIGSICLWDKFILQREPKFQGICFCLKKSNRALLRDIQYEIFHKMPCKKCIQDARNEWKFQGIGLCVTLTLYLSVVRLGNSLHRDIRESQSLGNIQNLRGEISLRLTVKQISVVGWKSSSRRTLPTTWIRTKKTKFFSSTYRKYSLW